MFYVKLCTSLAVYRTNISEVIWFERSIHFMNLLHLVEFV